MNKNITISIVSKPKPVGIRGIQNLSPRKVYRTTLDKIVVTGDDPPMRIVDVHGCIHWLNVFYTTPSYPGFRHLSGDTWKEVEFFPADDVALTFQSEKDDE